MHHAACTLYEGHGGDQAASRLHAITIVQRTMHHAQFEGEGGQAASHRPRTSASDWLVARAMMAEVSGVGPDDPARGS